MLGIGKHEAAEPCGGLSSSRMLGAQALEQAGGPGGIWAPSSRCSCWGPADSDPTSYTEAAPFLGRTFFPTPPALDSFRAGVCSLLIRAE